MTDIRSIKASGEQSGVGAFYLSGFIAITDNTLTGTLLLIDESGDHHTTAITGTVSGSDPETLTTTATDAATLDANGTGTIDSGGAVALTLSGTAPDATTSITAALTGGAEEHIVLYETPALDGDPNGLDVIDSVAINEPCLLADKLRVVRTQFISGQLASRVEHDGRSLYFSAAKLTELTAEIARLDALCAAQGGTNSQTDLPTVRTRRQIRINPYY
ncbi:MAG: hypothetical protein K8F25_14630 [Fimbriimonadaceae bacterium]|nr:hypothetical protein [Alphaproteobacteria bacterium]